MNLTQLRAFDALAKTGKCHPGCRAPPGHAGGDQSACTRVGAHVRDRADRASGAGRAYRRPVIL